MASKIDYKEITKLIDLLEKRKLVEFELEIEDFKIRIAREQKGAAPVGTVISAVPEPETAAAEPAEAIPESEEGVHLVTSPMVGTFYRSPDPSAAPFADVGDEVGPGQTLCIIEAMKLMNEIEADTAGTIEDVFVKNSQPVEYGQKLFSIRLK